MSSKNPKKHSSHKRNGAEEVKLDALAVDEPKK